MKFGFPATYGGVLFYASIAVAVFVADVVFVTAILQILVRALL